MAPVLLCPECGTKHPLDGITSTSSFPCSGCGRTLKVPAQAREMTAAAAGAAEAASSPPRAPVPPRAPAPAPAPMPPHSTQTHSAVPSAAAVAATAAAVPSAPPVASPQGIPPADPAREPARPAPASAASSAPPVWMRLLLWVVAVPLAFLIVFGFARAFGFLATNDITDIALAEGFHRYWPIIRLLPFVALLTALLVTGGVYGLARLRAGDRSQGSSGSRPPTGPKTRRPPAQSSRAGA